ncbi:pentatricopeptide repeat-containing protein At2g33680 [Cryptomeria japonica]|uniref:pentatricopeptide repeat-containing protein At2g33680 n=1 Tax=Cryptomeria japonica TaxID=3369 RepID=UPI0025AD7D64|nr:pentatricopeptide repeat-containing protein At2g33680 [Cryptomeria japonica]XP_057848027.1 pentatricopeptide repeat-containing protein At2g33680 [Cryptomeria japonica]XP_057848028.1 pentatricopeptide repeat-containing protein At2g33680 [Cryptomeria japonica]
MCKIGLPQQALRKPLTWVCLNMYVPVLQSAATRREVAKGKCIHAHIIKMGYEPNIFVDNNLANMYSKCGFLKDARQVFDRMSKRSVVSWNGIIAGYIRYSQYDEAMELFYQMLQRGLQPSEFTFGSLLKGVAAAALKEGGKHLHALVVTFGFEFDLFVQGALIDMYAKCKSVEYARQVFDKMPERDIVSWNAMVAGNVQNESITEALRLFCEMKQAFTLPNQFTFAIILKACADSLFLELGKVVHANVITSQLDLDVPLWNALIDMYVNCGKIDDAFRVFNRMPERDLVSWNAILAGYVQNGYDKKALDLFRQMQMAELKFDEFTIATVFRICDNLVCIEQGMQVHALVIKTGFQANLYVGTTLIDMLVTCRRMDYAIKVFSEIPKRDLILWGVLIAAYAHQGDGDKALELFYQMQQLGLKPDEFIFCSVLKACANLAILEQGKQIHVHILHSGFESNAIVGISLIDMYAKVGNIKDACIAFREMPREDVTSWNAMISGLTQHGHGRQALELFREMQDAGIKPDHVTFVGILNACSHLGLVDEGCYYFDHMNQAHGIIPRVEHYACMVDLLSRAGLLEEAECFVKLMPFKPSPAVWRTLLAACRIHGNMELGERVSESLFAMDIKDSATYVLLSNLYAAEGRWNDAAKVRKMMSDREVSKEAGVSWIEIKSKVHVFCVGH